VLYYEISGKYQIEYDQLWDKLVPPSGQAATLQGELVREIGRLTIEAYRDGNINWNYGTGYWLFSEFLVRYLQDPKVFNPEELREIGADIDLIRHYADEPFDLKCVREEEAYCRLTNRVVEWCLHYP
jgi:hypothetical protein